MVALGRGGVSYERSTSVGFRGSGVGDRGLGFRDQGSGLLFLVVGGFRGVGTTEPP